MQEILGKLIAHYKANFFTEPILVLTFIFCCVIGLLYHYRERERFFFLGYFFTGVALFVVSVTMDNFIFSGRERAIIDEIFNTTFELVEFSCFYYFFRKCLENKNIHKISGAFLRALFAISGIFFTVLWWPEYQIDKIREHSFYINVLEFFGLAFLCLCYFYELFTSAPKKTLFQHSSFLITTSTFFYSVLMIPFFIIARDIWKNERSLFWVLSSCHYLLLTIVLLTLARAFLRKIPITA